MENLGDCASCPLRDGLAAQGGKPVPFRGPLDAEIVILGQSPGQEEVDQMLPFVGPSGQYARDALATAGFNPQALLWHNACQCKPIGNAEVDAKAIRACSANAQQVIGAHPRKLIIALGNEAHAHCQNLNKLSGARAACGQVVRCSRYDCWEVRNVHPAFVLRSPSWQPEFAMALRRAKELLDTGEPRQPVVNITHPEGAAGIVETLDRAREHAVDRWVSFDIETDSVRISSDKFKSSYQEDHVLGLGFAWKEQAGPDEPPTTCAVYVPFHHGPQSDPVWKPDEWRDIFQAIQRIFEPTGGIKRIAQNGSFDRRYLTHQYGLDADLWFDTMIAHKLVQTGGKPNSLKFMARFYLNCPDWDIMDTIPVEQHLGHLPLPQVSDYCCYDCAYTLLLAEVFSEELDGKSYEKLLHHLDMPLFNELVKVELRGMQVDRDACEQVISALAEETQTSGQTVDITSGWAGRILPHKEKHTKKGELSKSCQIGVNASSSLDVGFILYDHFGLCLPADINSRLRLKYTNKKGSTRTDDTTIQYMLGQGIITVEHQCWPFVQAMLRQRSLKTLKGYMEGVVESIYPDGRVHCNYGFRQGTEELASPITGRLSSNSPNMQNVKSCLKPCWSAEPGCVIIEADYSALEIRVWTYMSQDPKLFDALTTGDFHTHTAAAAFETSPDEITKDQRAATKTAVFGMIYGGGPSVLGRAFGWPKARCETFLNQIYDQYPTGKLFLDKQVEHCIKHGWVETMFGRRRWLSEIWAKDEGVRSEAERQARNSPIQGGAAELTFLAIIRLSQAFEKTGMRSRICNTVHDSILVQSPLDEAKQAQKMLEETMVRPPFMSFNVPLLVETTVSERWGGELDLTKVREL